MVDENIKRKMLAQGYQEDVIEWHEATRIEALQVEFLKKNSVLSGHFEHVAFYEFMDDVFPDLDEYMVVTGEQGFKKMKVDELCDYQADKDNVYVVPASFINGYYSKATCKNLYALVIDVDMVKPETLKIVIENGNIGKHIPMPTYIVNSGSGVHFYYVFDKAIPFYPENRAILSQMYRVLCGITKSRIAAKTDWHSIVQPFRLPGSMTKLGQITRAFKTGEKWTFNDLGKRLGVDISSADLKERPLLSQDEYREWKEKQIQEGKRKPKKHREWNLSEKGNKGFYTSCLKRCFNETEEGHRYMSMVALSVVAFKVGVSKEQLQEDLEKLLRHYNEIGRVITHKEMIKSMRAYNPKAIKCTAETLQEWFGWDFKRVQEIKSKGRTQEEHVKIMSSVRNALYPNGNWRNIEGAPTKEQIIRDWRVEHPEGTPKECMEQTGISKNTVYKWWDEGKASHIKKQKKNRNEEVKTIKVTAADGTVLEIEEKEFYRMLEDTRKRIDSDI